MLVFYRISDKSYDKTKLIGTTKQFCFSNFASIFNNENIVVIADNCSEETINSLNMPLVIKTSLGNAGAIRYAIELALQTEEDIVYFAEDDYLYRNVNCPQLIREGLSQAEYVTLYDHPDKYESEYQYGEVSKVFRTPHSHWRHTISTTMTFATSTKTLKKDLDIWLKYTEGPHPWDHVIFSEIAQRGAHKLAVCIPGMACHTDLTYSAEKKKNLIDDWAIQLMHDHFEKQLLDHPDYGKIKSITPSLQKLMMMSTLHQ